MLRGNLGGLWPFGQSIPPPGETGAVELVRLRDYTLTAGGANDVRGYSTRLLGPKIPFIDETISGTDTILTSDHYSEVGGLRRWTASLELRIGLPRISRDVFAHLFGDAGRVWTSDPRFAIRGIPDDDLQVHYTTGGGLGYYTPVGAIRFDVGYKLNPSTFDLRHSQDVVDALRAGRSPTTAPVDHWRRYGFHLALGLYF
jgi:outer membrane protein assembly factor BamA